MTTTTPHTPTPWTLGDTEDHAGHWHISTDAHGIAYVYGGDYSQREREANARYIVHCVNTHDQLVAALEGVLACMEPRGYGLTVDRQITIARQALARAHGKE